jgi:hypothetical protein
MGLFCLTHEFLFPEGKPDSCPYCEITRLRSRIAALEGALAFYAYPSSWKAQGHSQIDADTAPIRRDKGSRARSVLNNTQNAPTASHSGEEASDVTKQA